MERGTPEGDASAGADPAARAERGGRSLGFLGGILLGGVLVAAAFAGLSLWLPPEAGRATPRGVAPAPGAEPFTAGGGEQPAGVGVTMPFSAGPSAAEGTPPAPAGTAPDAQPDGQSDAQPPAAEAEPGGSAAARPDGGGTQEGGTTARPESRGDDRTDAQPEGETGTSATAGAAEPEDRALANGAPSETPPAGTAPATDGGAAKPEDRASAQNGQPATEPEPAAGPQPDAGAPAGPDGASAEASAAPGPGGTASAPRDTTAAAGPALSVNARAFEAPPDAPLLSVVLVDRGQYELTAETLSMLTMPLTVAIRPETAGAEQLGRAARAAGHEVLADLSLPEQGAPAALAAEAAGEVAELDMAVGATATDGTAATEVLAPLMSTLAEDGLAWVGAGPEAPAGAIAREAGVPFAAGAATVAGDATADRIYAQIDSAARGALKGGSAVLFLGVSEPALQALIRWGLEHPQPVTLAPVSAVIGKRQAT